MVYLIYKAEIVCLSVCVFAISAHVSCSVALKLAVVAGDTGGQIIAGLTLPVLQFTESYPSISAFSFLSHSSNMVAEGIGGQAPSAIAR